MSDLLPTNSIAGRTLIVTLAIMAFLSMLALGAADLLNQTAQRWQGQIKNEITLQIKPIEGRDLDKDLKEAEVLLKAEKGILSFKIYSKDENARLLEPYLGAGLLSSDLPIPRLIAIKITQPAPNLTDLKQKLATKLPHALLEDHKPIQSRLDRMATTLVVLSLVVVIMIAATGILTVVFATRAAVAVNGAVVQVLHFVGAEDRYIAQQFERRFLSLGVKGAIFGIALAFVLFFALGLGFSNTRTFAMSDQMVALFGEFSLSWFSVIGSLLLIMLFSALTALTSRFTVMKALSQIE